MRQRLWPAGYRPASCSRSARVIPRLAPSSTAPSPSVSSSGETAVDGHDADDPAVIRRDPRSPCPIIGADRHGATGVEAQEVLYIEWHGRSELQGRCPRATASSALSSTAYVYPLTAGKSAGIAEGPLSPTVYSVARTFNVSNGRRLPSASASRCASLAGREGLPAAIHWHPPRLPLVQPGSPPVN